MECAPMIRANSPALDEILGQKFLIPSDGYVISVDYMGNDESIVKAARMSYGKDSGTPEQDEKLIRYLMNHRHTSPFEMCEIKFQIRLPMDVARQLVRHRTANLNEHSTRYTEAINEFNFTPSNQWRKQSQGNKQGSSEFLPESDGYSYSGWERDHVDNIFEDYRHMINNGVAREQARKVLPLGTYTEMVWKMDLHNLLHFLRLRMDESAQFEIRQYANVMAEIVKKWLPMTWRAFQDYVLDSITFSGSERRAMHTKDYSGLSEREIKELLDKLKLMNGAEP